jgi:hypothetical protein
MAGPRQPYDKALLAIARSPLSQSVTGSTLTVDIGKRIYTILNVVSGSGLCTVTLTPPTVSVEGYIVLTTHATIVRDFDFVSPSTVRWIGTEPTWTGIPSSTTRFIKYLYLDGVIYLSATQYAELLTSEQIVGMSELALYDNPNELFVRLRWNEGVLQVYDGLAGVTPKATTLGTMISFPATQLTGTINAARLPAELDYYPGVAFVSSTGNNLTAQIGYRTKAYATIQAAWDDEPTVIMLESGTHNLTANNRVGLVCIYGVPGVTFINWNLELTGNDIHIGLDLRSDTSVQINFFGYANNGEEGYSAEDPEDTGDPIEGGPGGDGGSVTGELYLEECLVDLTEVTAGALGVGGNGINGGDAGPDGAAGEYTIDLQVNHSIVTGSGGRFVTAANEYSSIDGEFMSVSSFKNGASIGSGDLVRASSPTITNPIFVGQVDCNSGTVGNRRFILPRLTTAERTAQSKASGDLLYETTLNRFAGRVGSTEVNLLDTSGGQSLSGPLMFSTNVTGATAGAVYPVSNTLRYRDSTNAERLLLNATDNLANLASISTARTNLGLGTMATEAASSYLALAGGTLTGSVNGTAITLTGTLRADRLQGAASTGYYWHHRSNATSLMTVGNVSRNFAEFNGSFGLILTSDMPLRWTSSTSIDGGDTNINRSSAGVLRIGTTATNALGSLQLTNLTATGIVTLGTYTVGTLPSAAANTRARAFASDSNLAFNSTNLGSTVTAGGSTLVPVFSNGSNWVIG